MVFFKVEDFDGLDSGKDYLFGGRTFTIYEAGENGVTEVFTSGNDFEALTARYLTTTPWWMTALARRDRRRRASRLVRWTAAPMPSWLWSAPAASWSMT